MDSPYFNNQRQGYCEIGKFLILFHSGESMHRREVSQGIRDPQRRLMQPKCNPPIGVDNNGENPV